MAFEDMLDTIGEGPSPEAIKAFRLGMRSFWHPVCQAAELVEGTPLAVMLLGARLVLARLDGTIGVLPDVCRHFQAALSLGEITRVGDKAALQCPYHGWAFGPDGACLRIPQLPPGRAIPDAAHLPSYRATERYGLVWVHLGEGDETGLPEFPEHDDGDFRKVRLTEAGLTRTSATRMIMGTLDDTHFPWVHEGILGERDRPEPPDHRAWRDGTELRVDYEILQPSGLVAADSTGDGGKVRIRYSNHVHMPCVIRLIKDMPDGRYVIWLAASPVDYDKTRNFWIFARNYDRYPARDKIYEEMSAHVRLQDKPVIESQRPWLIPPFWSRIQMPVGPGDVPLIEYQRWLQELKIATAI
jgi:vanillate O-demethylase monooxygenase subunit